MSKKSPDVRGLLFEGHFGHSRMLPPSDPIAATPMLLYLDQIVAYDRNPRREHNEQYERIKNSIKARGLDAPLRITRRPGDPKYMIAAGGNTRLSALEALWEQTGEKRFFQVHCLFTPWVSESDVLGAHLIENELRSDLVLIDKALALRDLKDLLEAEAGTPLARIAFQRRLDALGYRLSRRQLIRYDYAVDHLYPLIPIALHHGLGGRFVDLLQNHEKAYCAVHQALSTTASIGTFGCLWEDVLTLHDSPTLDDAALRQELDAALAKQLGVSVGDIRSKVKAAMNEPTPSGTDDEDLHAPSSRGGSGAQEPEISMAVVVSPVSLNAPKSKRAEAMQRGEPHEIVAAQALPPRLDPDLLASKASDSSHAAEVSNTPSHSTEAFLDKALDAKLEARDDHPPRPDDLKSWRSRCAVQALRFAQRVGLGGQVRPTQEGMGFVVDAPPSPLTDDALARASWWLLYGLSEQGLTPDRQRLIAEDTQLHRLLQEGGHHALFERVHKPLSASFLGYQLLTSRNLSASAFRDLLLLMESCRDLKGHFRESDLWACPTVEQFLQSSAMRSKE